MEQTEQCSLCQFVDFVMFCFYFQSHCFSFFLKQIEPLQNLFFFFFFFFFLLCKTSCVIMSCFKFKGQNRRTKTKTKTQKTDSPWRISGKAGRKVYMSRQAHEATHKHKTETAVKNAWSPFAKQSQESVAFTQHSQYSSEQLVVQPTHLLHWPLSLADLVYSTKQQHWLDKGFKDSKQLFFQTPAGNERFKKTERNAGRMTERKSQKNNRK